MVVGLHKRGILLKKISIFLFFAIFAFIPVLVCAGGDSHINAVNHFFGVTQEPM